jgi:hypothetical protein
MIDQHVNVGATKGFTLPRDCEVTIVPAGHRTAFGSDDPRSHARFATERTNPMKVWIDQDFGSGLCEEVAHDAFFGPHHGLHGAVESTEE